VTAQLAAPPPRRRLRRFLAAVVALVVLVLLTRWVAARMDRTARREHLAAVARAAAEPGTLVSDPTVPAGAVVVDLIRASQDLDELRRPATVQAGDARGEWTPEAPVLFEGMGDAPPRPRRPIWIAGPYAAETAAFAPPVGPHGGWIAVRVLPIDPAEDNVAPRPGWGPERVLEVDITDVRMLHLRWRQGRTVIMQRELPPLPDPAFADHLRSDWPAYREHFDPYDRKLDRAIVRIAPAAPFEAIFPVVEVILSVRRRMHLGGEDRDVSAFDVSVQPVPTGNP
jgi:hypothetical protein